MKTRTILIGVSAIAVISIGAGAILGLADPPQLQWTVEFGGLMLAGILASAFSSPATATDWAHMPPSFVITFASLLLLGPETTMIVAVAGALAQEFADVSSSRRIRRMAVNAGTAVVATQAAGLAYWLSGGSMGGFVWPWQGVPMAAAVVSYCLVTSASAEIVVPLVARLPVIRSWPRSILRGLPSHFIGASLAAGLVEVIDHRMWQILPVAAVPLYFAYRAYASQASRLDEEHRRQEVVEALDQGIAVLDGTGRITLWSESLERILGCPRGRAIGGTLVEAAPHLSKTELPRAMRDALTDRMPRTLAAVALPAAAGAKILQVRVLPVVDGITLIWHDVTERARADQALRRSEERLALAAEGANDGLWEWDLRNQEFYFSSRWASMLGLRAPGGIGHPEAWMDRVHTEDTAALTAALEAHLSGKTDHFEHEHRIRHESGAYRWFLARGVAVRGDGLRPVRIAGSLTDTTEGAIAQERLRSAGFRDPLTGLANRAVFVDRLGRRLAEFKERPIGSRFAALYLDLDRFKVVNDSLGHLVGDELLTAVSRRLESCLRQGDALARLGGDEFAILLNEIGDEGQANAISFRIQDALNAPFSIGGRKVFTSASIGIAFGGVQYTNPDDILRDADTAMYHAKSRGKARHELFDADMHARELDRLGLENDLRHAVNQNDFEVVYQPIVSLASGMCVGFESLVRWTRNGVAVSPVTFVPIAEELGLIEPLGTWILQQACTTFAGWQRQFPESGLDYITVNVSSRQLTQQNFFRIVEQAVEVAGLKPCDLRLEITETALMDSPQAAAGLLRQLRNFGVKIYLDDFGTGYSSLSHLHKLPVDALKIDRSFVKSLLLPDRPAIVESILALARTLGTSVVAEGIESDTQARELERLGCTHAQGYLFSRPLSMRSAEAVLAANQPLGPKNVKPSEPAGPAGSTMPPADPSQRFEWLKELMQSA